MIKKMRYVGEDFFPYLTPNKIYDIIAVEKGPDLSGKQKETDWIRVVCDCGDDYIFLPNCFEDV